MDIKPGGGSVVYGSGAIGGSIHLNNTLDFNKGLKGSLYSETGSYETFNTILRTSYSNEKLSVKFSGNYAISKNDYEVEEKITSTGMEITTIQLLILGYLIS